MRLQVVLADGSGTALENSSSGSTAVTSADTSSPIYIGGLQDTGKAALYPPASRLAITYV